MGDFGKDLLMGFALAAQLGMRAQHHGAPLKSVEARADELRKKLTLIQRILDGEDVTSSRY